MKKQMIFLAMAFALWIFAASTANATNVTLEWNDHSQAFIDSGSDPVESGFKVWKSQDGGVTKTEITTIPDVSETTYTYVESENGHWCYFLTAFNQYGGSVYSAGACGYISNGDPGCPQGITILITINVTP